MYEATFSPCITYKGSESGHPCLKPLESCTDGDRKTLSIIIELLPTHKILKKFIKAFPLF